MKYCTKEWYAATQRTNMHLLLKPSDRAAAYSELYFQELYAQRMQEQLDMIRRASAVDREALAARIESSDAPLMCPDGKAVTPEQQKQVDALRRTIAENLRKAPSPIFNPEAVKRNAHDQYLHTLQHLEHNLPDTIQRKVADMRVLALGHATREVIDEIAAFCQSNEAAVHAAIDAYHDEFRHNFSDRKPPFHADFDLHDCRVISVRWDGGDMRMLLEDCACLFRDAEIIHCDAPPEDANWLYDEIHPSSDGYEIHALLERGEAPLEFTLRCRNVEIIWASE